MLPYKKNILCIEGQWVTDLSKHNSVSSGLELLQKNGAIAKQQCIVSHSSENTLKLLKQFSQKRYSSFSLIYLSFHGSPGLIGWNKEALALDKIRDELTGKLTGKTIHFGSCETLKQPKRVLNDFLKSTGAEAISGFTEQVPFIESTLFDLLFFERCQYTESSTKAAAEMKTDYRGLCKRLGFSFIPQK